MKRIENVYEITQRLLGSIEPLGQSSMDEVRLDNLENTIELVEKLTKDIIYVGRYKTSYENSVKKIGERADRFITETREELTTEPHFTESQIQQLQNKVYEITGEGKVMGLFNELLGICVG